MIQHYELGSSGRVDLPNQQRLPPGGPSYSTICADTDSVSPFGVFAPVPDHQDGAAEFSGAATSGSVFLNWGEYLCPGGVPAGPWPPNPPCSPGSRVHVRGLVHEFSVVSDDNRVTGLFHNVYNADTDGRTPFGLGSGQLWGTSRLEVMNPVDRTPTGEVWEGN